MTNGSYQHTPRNQSKVTNTQAAKHRDPSSSPAPSSPASSTASGSPGPAPAPRFTVSDVRRPPSAPLSFASVEDCTRQSHVGPTAPVVDQAWTRQQRDAVRQHRATKQREFTEAHETAVVSAAPIHVRLSALLAEARRYEVSLIRARYAADPRDLQDQRRRHVDAAYANLIEDVKRRCGVIAAHNPEPAQQHSLGNEAIGCFSSMLPWSEGVVAVDVERPATPTWEAAAYHQAQQAPQLPKPAMEADAPPRGRRLPRGLRPRMTPNGALKQQQQQQSPDGAADHAHFPAAAPAPRASSAPPAVTYRWTVPQRLAVDNRKLAACTNARRKRLATLTPPPQAPRSPQPSAVCSPPTAMPC
jgi:hypothetical protein